MDIIKIRKSLSALKLRDEYSISEKSIKDNFRELAKLYHPDTSGNSSSSDEFRVLKEAKEYLLDNINAANEYLRLTENRRSSDYTNNRSSGNESSSYGNTREQDNSASTHNSDANLVDAIVSSAFQHLNKSEWVNAEKCFNQVLALDPRNAKAYLGLLMLANRCKSQEDLKKCNEPLENNNYFKQAIIYGDEKQKSVLRAINEITKINRLNQIYFNASSIFDSAKSESEFIRARDLFLSISGFKDADERAHICNVKAEEAKSVVEQVINKKKNNRTTLIVIVIFIPLILLSFYLLKLVPENSTSNQQSDFDKAYMLYENGRYNDAVPKFTELAQKGDPDAQFMLAICYADGLGVNQDYKKARNLLTPLSENGNEIAQVVLGYCYEFDPNLLFWTKSQALSLYRRAIMHDDPTVIELITTFSEQGSEYCAEVLDEYEKSKPVSIEDAEIGDIIEFGSYPNIILQETRPVNWFVLDKQNNNLLLLSFNYIERMEYNETMSNVTWETCTIRSWLNESFLNTAFTYKEQEKIVITTNENLNNPEYGTIGGNKTVDKVFLLSVDEVNKYIINNSAFSDSNSIFNKKNSERWWLRSPGKAQTEAVVFRPVGDLDIEGFHVSSADNYIRPALWINNTP